MINDTRCFRGEAAIDGETLVVEVAMGHEKYSVNGVVIAEYNGIGKGLVINRKLDISGKQVEVIVSFDKDNLHSKVLSDGVLVKDPLFEQFELIKIHGYESSGWKFFKVAAVVVGVAIVVYLAR